MSSTSVHVGSLLTEPAVFENDLGSITQLTSDSLPILDGLSIKRIVLAPGAIREPQWNANANQIAYVVSGTVLVSTLGNAGSFSAFVVTPGQMYHIESGAVYHIENIGVDEAVVISALRNDRPQHFSLQDSLSAMTNNVLGNTYGLPTSAFDVFDRRGSSQIVRREGPPSVPDSAGLPNARLFDVEGQRPPLSYAYGDARLARKQFWAALDDLSMYSLRIRESGMREPHWHPVTAELGYVHRGHARMRVLDPDGTLDEFVLEKGNAYFIPRAYPHHIEVLGEDDIHFLIFFDQPTPGDIGYRATASAFSREVLAASFGLREKEQPQFPYTPVDPLIVSRTNPRDPVS
jgi:oxalate decarboxylase